MTVGIPPMVRAVLFDAVGTLLHPEPSAVDAYLAVGRRYGSRLDAATVAGRFRTAFVREETRDREASLRTSEKREVERWRCIVATVLDDVRDGEACFAELFAHFGEPSAWRLEPGAAEVLGELARRGYLLGVASNLDARLRRIVAGAVELTNVEHLVISSEVGWRKPAPEFFVAACRQLGLPPNEVLLVGDDLENDHAGARNAGMHARLLDPKGRGTVAATERLASLGELLTG